GTGAPPPSLRGRARKSSCLPHGGCPSFSLQDPIVTTSSLDSFKCRRTLEAGGKTSTYYSLVEAERNGLDGISRLPVSLKVLLENLLRHEDGRSVTADDIRAVAKWLKDRISTQEIAFRPARVLMQDFTGV